MRNKMLLLIVVGSVLSWDDGLRAGPSAPDDDVAEVVKHAQTLSQAFVQETLQETVSAGGRYTSDLENLGGTWLTVSLVNDGKTLVDEKSPPKKGPATKLVYVGNTWIIKVGDKTVASGVFKIDANKMPKEIDIMDESGVKNEKTKLGIYELDGDTYKYCLAPAAKPRPTAFTSEPGSGHSLGVSKREKP